MNFIKEYQQNVARLIAGSAYDPADEHDGCGVGFIAAMDGKPRRDVVEKGIEALQSVWHRGAIDADGKTGDGAGIHITVPQQFFRDHVKEIGYTPDTPYPLAVGQVFLPRLSQEAQERCRCIIETQILRFGYRIYGWRQVPINNDVIGDKANATRPEIEQIIIANSLGVDEQQFEQDLYIIRRSIEKEVTKEHINDCYICSLSACSLIYKGMFLAEQLSAFYPDLVDPRFKSSFAIYHQRYSTNTFPTWPLAQPFHMIAHNGEINTLKGNINWINIHEPRMEHARFHPHLNELKPILPISGSDSLFLDAVFEILVRAGRSAPMVKTLLIPGITADLTKQTLPSHHHALYSYCNAVIEPWDGPAAIVAYDGQWVIAGMDRNGLRPMRFTITADGLVIAGSETGMVRIDPAQIVEQGQLGPGQMIGVDLKKGCFYHNQSLQDKLAAPHFQDWIKQAYNLNTIEKTARTVVYPIPFKRDEMYRRLMAVGITFEDLELILHPMVEEAKESTGSMGDDTPIAVLSNHYRGLHHFFRQNFSQVTNPPIDSLRERHVMSLKTRFGNLGNILVEEEAQCRLLELDSPLLHTSAFYAIRDHVGSDAVEIDCTFPVNPHDRSTPQESLPSALQRIRQEAEKAMRHKKTAFLILTDEHVASHRAPIPMILATGTVHTHLLRIQKRAFTSINVRTSECLDVHYAAILIGVGATTVNPYLTEITIIDRHSRGLFKALSLEQCLANYKKAIDDGLLKIMSKMGISIISTYRGGCHFEAIGLSRSLVAEHFPAMVSRISGIGLLGIESKILAQHTYAYDRPDEIVTLPIGSFYHSRAGGEFHHWQGKSIHVLQSAVAQESYTTYKRYTDMIYSQPPIQLRDLLDFKPTRQPISIDDIESITTIYRRFVTPGMSLGSLSPEAHGTLNVAMNRIGAKSDSGEGGEDPRHFQPDANGDNWNSAIKQVASGRFGVTAEYLNQCREIEIKIAQGAKPGEGGQLPGFKVTDLIAKIRHATPGVTLISPPPHHDIYSIEDLAQLIFDLKQINPEAKVCVKLVARTGIGTIATGVAKAKADVILISGHSGGTGASPRTSIKYAGVPWEMGLSEVHQMLTLNRLRHRVTLRVDGGLKTGRDIIIGAILGADEFGIGTASLVAMGCLLVRQCHTNTCPVGVCTQDDSLRKKFTGSPEKVINLLHFLAWEVREILARLGYVSLNDIIGHTELLHQVTRGAPDLDSLDLNPLLIQVDPGHYPRYCTLEGRNPVPDTLDVAMIKDATSLFEKGEKLQLTYHIRNTDRTIGTRLASLITRQFGMTTLKSGHIKIRLHGSAGQSLGAFAVQGMKIELFGDANDYVGKGLSGGQIVIRPRPSSTFKTHENTIVGNTVLYGATSGDFFASGRAGERFAVRNSGAHAVIEGCGANGCEYMTGGQVVILGSVGDNFAAGMTGGMAFVYDINGDFLDYLNADSVHVQGLQDDIYEQKVRALIRSHVDETKSIFAESLLNDWAREREKFWHIVPHEMINRLEVPLTFKQSSESLAV